VRFPASVLCCLKAGRPPGFPSFYFMVPLCQANSKPPLNASPPPPTFFGVFWAFLTVLGLTKIGVLTNPLAFFTSYLSRASVCVLPPHCAQTSVLSSPFASQLFPLPEKSCPPFWSGPFNPLPNRPPCLIEARRQVDKTLSALMNKPPSGQQPSCPATSFAVLSSLTKTTVSPPVKVPPVKLVPVKMFLEPGLHEGWFLWPGD